jgi:hypothetical protein
VALTRALWLGVVTNPADPGSTGCNSRNQPLVCCPQLGLSQLRQDDIEAVVDLGEAMGLDKAQRLLV